jgi:hypothetical protein
MIAACVLVLMLNSNMVQNFAIGDAKLSGPQMTWETILVVGFVAGFLERLVPDLLKKTAAREEAPAVRPPAPPPVKAPAAGAPPAPPPATAPAAGAQPPPPPPPPAQAKAPEAGAQAAPPPPGGAAANPAGGKLSAG